MEGVQVTIEAWESFHAHAAGGDIDESVPDVIAESWLRSHEVGVAFNDLAVPRRDVDAHSAFVETAVPVLLDMADLLVGSSTSLALTDEAGTVVWRWDSEPDITRGLDDTEVEPGSSMGESNVGTNGIAVAAALKEPATVVGAQHYKEAWHRWACAASPVFHPVTRRMAGVVNVACRAEDANHLLNVAVRAMAREVQVTLRANATLPEQRLLGAHLKRRRLTANPLVSVNPSTLIADDAGLRMNLNHALVWSQVRTAGLDEAEIQIAPGVRARVHRVLPGRPDAGVTLEILHIDPDTDGWPVIGAARTELEVAEMRVIRAALNRHEGNKLAVARELGISRGTLYSRLRRYKIDHPTRGER